MFGGVGKAGWATILATGGMMLGASVSAQAADLGGNCCADLEERVAELEATTARKGNRKVKLEIYGQVNEAVMFWDDGFEQNAYVVTNDASRSRFGFKGGAKINDDWSANFKIEIGVRSANSKRSNQNDSVGKGNPAQDFDVRHVWWNLKSKKYGTFQVGHTPTATEDITEANLAGTNPVGKYSDVEDSGLGMLLRNSAGGLSAIAWRRLLKHTGDAPGEGDRRQAILYVSPEFAGFAVSAAWGSDDSWDAGLTYEGEFNGFKLLGRVGYGQNTQGVDDEDAFFGCVDTTTDGGHCQQAGGSVSVLHEPTGLYTNFAAGWFKDDDVANSGAFAAALSPDDESTFWAVEAGIHKKWIDLGPTTIFAQYYDFEGGANARQSVAAGDAINSFGAGAARIFTSEVEMFGLGIAQDIKAADMKLYALYRHYETDVSLSQGVVVQDSRSLEDLDILMTGAIIKF
jgi:predicted porin